MVNIGLAVHKAPSAYRQCWQVYNDTARFVTTFSSIDVPIYFADVSLNLLLNFIDIYLEGVDAVSCLKKGQYGCFGTNIGKIISDALIKNPLTNDWSLHNSEVFTREGVTEKGPTPLGDFITVPRSIKQL